MGSIIEDKDEQLSNVEALIKVTELGITILVSAVQYWKMPNSIIVSEEGRVIDARFIQPWKMEDPMVVTPEGITRVVSPEQAANTFGPSAARDAENVTLVSAVQP